LRVCLEPSELLICLEFIRFCEARLIDCHRPEHSTCFGMLTG
jgi:hypothetical protein